MTTWIKNQPTAALRRCTLVVQSLLDGSFAPAATSLSGLVEIRLGGTSWAAASGSITNTGKDGHWIYEATQAETNVTANEIEVRITDSTWYALTQVQIDSANGDVLTALAAVAASLVDVAGLLHKNSLVDNVVRDPSTGFMTSARLRIFADASALAAATVGAADNADSEIARFTITGTHTAGLMTTFKASKAL